MAERYLITGDAGIAAFRYPERADVEIIDGTGALLDSARQVFF